MPTKTWVVGEEVLAADFNTYVQNQVVAQYANKAAIDAVTSPPNGAVALALDTGMLWVRRASVWQPPAGTLVYSADVVGTVGQAIAVGNNDLVAISPPVFPYPVTVHATYDCGARNSVAPNAQGTCDLWINSLAAAVGPGASFTTVTSVAANWYVPMSVTASWTVAAGGNAGSKARMGLAGGYGGVAQAVSRGSCQIWSN